MTVAVANPFQGGWTGSIFGTRSRDDRAPQTITDHSLLDGRLLNPDLRDMVPLWDEALIPTASDAILADESDPIIIHLFGTAPSAPIRFLLVKPAEISASEKAVQDLERLREILDLPIRDVAKAAGVPRRTYYSWRESRKEVRLGATHRLADLQLAVEDLQDLLGNHLQEWIRQARLVDLMRKGQFNDLLQEASTWHARTHPMDEDPAWSRQVEDRVDDQPPISDVPRVRRHATTRTPTTRRKGQSGEV